MCYPTTSEHSDNNSIIEQCVHDPFENTHVNETTDIVDTSLPTLLTSRCVASETDEQKLIELGKKAHGSNSTTETKSLSVLLES